jgi:fatty acid desaturase
MTIANNINQTTETTCAPLETKAIHSPELVPHTEYAQKLRPLLPPEAFQPDFNKVWLLLINVLILISGWAIASYLDRWSVYYLWLFIPIAIVMGNSITVLGFSSHGMMHNSAIQNPKLRQFLSLLGFTMLWMPPTLWKAVHNREHHYKTNSEQDPDRNYTFTQANSWGKWFQNLLLPSSEVNPILLVLGMMHVWGLYTFRHLSSVLLFDNGWNPRKANYPVATFSVSNKDRQLIVAELLLIMGFHGAVLASLQFSPIKVLLGYFLPIWIGYAIAIFYIYTNHLLCPMTETNDALVNSLSIRVPKICDALHINFSYHTEHHIFPSLNPDYYPLVQQLLIAHYPERFNLVDASRAWQLMRETPRHYLDAYTLTDWTGSKAIPCPNLNHKGA